jgi:8-oxo-dGTP pyrophosphatase MutT (NUDIX family)
MSYTTRTDFPEVLPDGKTFYCWHCHKPGVKKTDAHGAMYSCKICGHSEPRVLIYDPGMQQYFDAQNRLVHASCGVFIVRNDGKLLLFKRRKFPFLLTIPAGHMEVGEDPSVCARREMLEEIGIDAPQLSAIFEGNIEGDACLGGADIHYWYAYAAAIDSNNLSITLDSEGEAWGWYDPAELSAHNTVQPVWHMLQQPVMRRKLAAVLLLSK